MCEAHVARTHNAVGVDADTPSPLRKQGQKSGVICRRALPGATVQRAALGAAERLIGANTALYAPGYAPWGDDAQFER